jgi:hypothetical protein
MIYLLQGIASYELRLLLSALVRLGVFTLKELNQAIQGFEFGWADRKNKPSELPELVARKKKPALMSKLNQRGMQVWCLLRTLGLIIGDNVAAFIREHESEEVDLGDDENADSHAARPVTAMWQFYLELRDICSVIFAPKITEGMRTNLRVMLHSHARSFKRLFPEQVPIPQLIDQTCACKIEVAGLNCYLAKTSSLVFMQAVWIYTTVVCSSYLALGTRPVVVRHYEIALRTGFRRAISWITTLTTSPIRGRPTLPRYTRACQRVGWIT